MGDNMKKTAAILSALLMVFSLCISFEAAGEYYIKVNRTTNCVTVYDSEDKPVKSMICSVGDSSEGNSTPAGSFRTSQKLRWHALFGNEFGQYCTRIDGPILFHSVPYFSENPGDLNTADYNALGSQDSLGCVRLSVADAKWIYDNCPIGTSVNIFDGSEKDDPLGRPDAIKLGAEAPYPTWDPTDPDENNPWKGCGVTITAEKNIHSVYQNSYQSAEDVKEYLKTGVKAYDSAKNEIDFTVETDADPTEPGVYKAVFSAEDSLGKKASKNAVFIVLPGKLISNASIKE